MLRTLKRPVKAAGLNCGKCDGCHSNRKSARGIIFTNFELLTAPSCCGPEWISELCSRLWGIPTSNQRCATSGQQTPNR
jgi:hypothetical protein